METRVAHGPDGGGRGQVLSQTSQVESPLPGVALVQGVLRVEHFLMGTNSKSSPLSRYVMPVNRPVFTKLQVVSYRVLRHVTTYSRDGDR